MRIPIGIILAYTAILFSIMGIFMGVKATYEESNDSWNPIIEAACSVTSVNSIGNKYLYNKCLIDSGIMAFPFAILLTIILTDGRIDDCAEFGASVAGLTWKTRAKRFLAILAYPALGFLPISILFSVVISPTQTYPRYFIQMALASGAAGALFIKMSPIMLRKYALEIKGDFMVLPSNILDSSSSNNNNNNHIG